MEDEKNFGSWLKRRRRQLDLTQQQLADCAACSVVTIRKFENGERRPSRELAELLAGCLAVPGADQEAFVAFARGLQATFSLSGSDATGGDRPPAASGPAPWTTFGTVLPLPATPFVGREAELAQIAAKLVDPACRLLTLVGPGGMGKTRLALAAAAGQGERFPDGVAFVPLAAVGDPALLPQAIAHSLNITLSGPEDPVAQLGRILHGRRLLLILDNAEGLLPRGADLLASWLREAPHTKWLVTSRERLNLIEEWLLPVHGFDQLETGMALFVQSARRVRPDFSPDDQETAVAHICQYVGGMPLAIELAAGWTAVLTCEQILAQMRQTFDFLSTSLRNVPQRHRSLRYLFDQSWQLLLPEEQAVMMKLTVFRGGFAFPEAEAVAGATLPLLLGLTSKSLILADGQGRNDLHELIRQYGAEKLRESGQEMAACRRHLVTFAALAKRAGPLLYGPDAIAVFKQLDDDLDNFRAALEWGTVEADGEAVLELVNNLWWFWFRRGYWREAERWLAVTLEMAEPADSPARCWAMLSQTACLGLQGRYDEAGPYLLGALAMARRLDDVEPLAAALMVVGQAAPDLHQALAAFAEAQAILESAGGTQRFWMLPYLHYLVGDRLRENGRYAAAAERYRQSLVLYRQMGNVDGIAYPLGNLGRLALQDGRLDEARALIEESLALSRAIGNRQGMSDWLIPLGLVMLYQGDVSGAVSHLQEGLVAHGEMGSQRGRADALACLALAALAQGDTLRADQYIRDSLAVYRESWQRGRAVNLALSDAPDHIVPDFVDAFFVAGLVSAALGQYERAAACNAIASRLQKQLGYRPIPFFQQRIDAADQAVRQNVASSAYEAAWAAGQEWQLDEAFQFALA
jgi:predicted ATPase/transcriptional regulator with XRE-family HTH domain